MVRGTLHFPTFDILLRQLPVLHPYLETNQRKSIPSTFPQPRTFLPQFLPRSSFTSCTTANNFTLNPQELKYMAFIWSGPQPRTCTISYWLVAWLYGIINNPTDGWGQKGKELQKDAKKLKRSSLISHQLSHCSNRKAVRAMGNSVVCNVAKKLKVSIRWQV